MNTKNITLIVFDEKENFNSPNTQLRIGEGIWNKTILVENRADFDREYDKLGENEDFLFICHVFHAAEGSQLPLRGYLRLANSGIEDDYAITAILVSSGDSGEVMKNLNHTEKVSRPVHIYSGVTREVKVGKIHSYTKSKLKSVGDNIDTTEITIPKIDYAILTALYKDEFEALEKYFEWTSKYATGTKEYKIGNLKNRPDKRVVAAVPSATGMIDASIIATQMLEIFKPKFLFMSGVCGGVESLNFGDIVLAKKIFMFQKGKLSDINNKEGKPIQLFDQNKQAVDINALYDDAGTQIMISVEKFEIEHDTMIEFDSLLQDRIEPQLDKIKMEINDELKPYSRSIDIHFESMACSSMVINKAGFFNTHIKSVDRKTVAVEMESYGVGRACKFANDGKTKCVIFKSVMDNMVKKDDTAKRFAAHTSALFLKTLLEKDIC